ncbi:hypothetical protein GCM10023322_17290 [Rugosimonospora acidiphila]|uniref:Uncharacterized protein n=1 Tax=Rugosimonospora acidiphila TaxID=556531 RepID=A0ABP9RPG8_9ACTN
MFPDPTAPSPRPDAAPAEPTQHAPAGPDATPAGQHQTAPHQTAPPGYVPQPAEPAWDPPAPAWPAGPPQPAPPVWDPSAPAWPAGPPEREAPQRVASGPSTGLARVGKIILVRIAVAALAIAAVVAFAVVRGDRGTGVQAFPTTGPTTGARVTNTPRVNPDAPFDGTPAASYPDGAAGLVMPEATAVTGFSRQQVADALAQVRQALIAARLDDRMLTQHDADGFISLFASAERDDLRGQFDDHKFTTYASQIGSGHRLLPTPPRVKGQTTFKATTNSNEVDEIQITTNYVWVYAFDAPASQPGDNLVIVHDNVTWEVPSSAEVSSADRGLWLDQSESYVSNVDCNQFDQGLIAPGVPQPDTGGGSEDPNSMFDPNRSLDIANTC